MEPDCDWQGLALFLPLVLHVGFSLYQKSVAVLEEGDYPSKEADKHMIGSLNLCALPLVYPKLRCVNFYRFSPNLSNVTCMSLCCIFLIHKIKHLTGVFEKLNKMINTRCFITEFSIALQIAVIINYIDPHVKEERINTLRCLCCPWPRPWAIQRTDCKTRAGDVKVP